MSAQHTPGRLEVDNTGYRTEHNGLCLMIWPECIAVVGAGCPDQPQEANARRLVACWNACDGAPTELLEAYPAPFTELRAQRDELLAALRRCREMVGHPDNIAEIDATIAKVKGGAV